MKDYFNPLFTLIIVGGMAWCGAMQAEGASNQQYAWVLSLCVVGVLVNGVLALARAFTRQLSMGVVVWTTVYFVLGCCTWTIRSSPSGTEQAIYDEQRQNAAQTNPLVTDTEGESLFTRAAALGKVHDVEHILNTASPTADQIARAALRAAENNHVSVLQTLAKFGLSATATVDGLPLLHAAAQNGACEAIDWLILSGARTNERDTTGSTALIQATLSESLPAVKLLLERGADLKLRDEEGKCAWDYARSPEMADLLTPTRSAP